MSSRFCIKTGSSISLIFKFLWMAVCMTIIGRLRESPMKRKLYYYAYTTCFQILGGSLSAVITYHHTENKPKNGICVANHTTPIDVLILACDNAYDLVSIRFFLDNFYIIQTIDELLLSLCQDRADSRRIYRYLSRRPVKVLQSHLVREVRIQR